MNKQRPNQIINTILSSACAILWGTTSVLSQNYGVHFLGNTSDDVTGTAGVVPIPGWNNIGGTFTSGTITSSDGSSSATVTMSGAWPGDGGWNSGLAGNGSDLSLLHGFLDAGNPALPATATITGLPAGQLFNVYVYAFGDSAKPGGTGNNLPNYSVNGTTLYAPVLGVGASTYTANNWAVGNGFTSFTAGTTTNANSPQEVVFSNFGNYIVVSNVVPVSGVITVEAEPDGTTYRSPLDGFELVAVQSSPSLSAHVVGKNIVLNWSAGILLQSPSLKGPWTTNSTAATLVATNSLSAPQMFYRVQVP
jgi:hypothetical protein